MARTSLQHRVSPQARRSSSKPSSFPASDPPYQAITLRGLARLIRSASKNEYDRPNLDDLDVSFFISNALYENADKLEAS